MFTVSGQTIKYDVAWTHPDTGVQYPANWLRLTTLAEKQAVGLVEVVPTLEDSYDERFYVGVDIPKPLDDTTDDDGNVTSGLKTFWKSIQDQTAASLLRSSDWRVIKAKETSTNIPSVWKTYRAAVRTACNTRQSEIDACTDVAALKELLFGADQVDQNDEVVANPNLATAWPAEPS